MRVAVISDIHANHHALEAVLAEVLEEQPDEVWCLGDVVGYGPEPNRCCRLVAEHTTLCLAGNHDLAVLGSLSVADFNGDAAAAVRWTQTALADDARTFLTRCTRRDPKRRRSLPRQPDRPGLGLRAERGRCALRAWRR